MISFTGGPLDGQKQRREITGAMICLNVQLPRCMNYRRLAVALYEYADIWEKPRGKWHGKARFLGFFSDSTGRMERLRRDGSRMPVRRRAKRLLRRR